MHLSLNPLTTNGFRARNGDTAIILKTMCGQEIQATYLPAAEIAPAIFRLSEMISIGVYLTS